MNDDELRRAFHSIAYGELPPDFPDRVLASLPGRTPRSARRPALIVAGAVVAGVLVVALLSRVPPSGPDPTAGLASPSPVQTDAPDAIEDIVLSVEVTPGGPNLPGRSNEVVFALEGTRAVYRDYDWGLSRSEERVAYLTPAQAEALIAYAVGPGGLADARTEYPHASRGPSGETVISIASPQLTKTVTYGLPPGNLTRDEDPTLGGLPELMERLGHFSTDVEGGDASGGMLLNDVEASIRAAFADERLTEVLAKGGHTVERVVPAERDGEALVLITIGPEQRWPEEMAVCESGQTTGEMTGIVWLVDVDQERVLAVSPRWGSFDCLGG